jgi:hypothetical protein
MKCFCILFYIETKANNLRIIGKWGSLKISFIKNVETQNNLYAKAAYVSGKYVWRSNGEQAEVI